jgi:hypothetical protein
MLNLKQALAEAEKTASRPSYTSAREPNKTGLVVKAAAWHGDCTSRCRVRQKPA